MTAKRSEKQKSPQPTVRERGAKRANASRSVRLSELADIDPETFAPVDPIHFHYVDLGSIEEPGSRPETTLLNSIHRPSRAQRKTRNGDLLVSNVRPYLRNFSRIDGYSASDVVVASRMQSVKGGT